jgi:hypothetical protein
MPKIATRNTKERQMRRTGNLPSNLLQLQPEGAVSAYHFVKRFCLGVTTSNRLKRAL